jgi:hypothetical protein
MTSYQEAIRQGVTAYREARDRAAGTDDEFGGPPEVWTPEEAIERIKATATPVFRAGPPQEPPPRSLSLCDISEIWPKRNKTS